MSVLVTEKIEAVYERLERAKELIAKGLVKPILGIDDHFVCESSTGKGSYLINGNCSCPDAKQRSELTNGLCKHKLATLLYLEANDNTDKNEREDLGW